jgi:hypothetical protein
MFREVTTGKHGGDRKSNPSPVKSDNITLDDGRGTSRSYVLSRLKKSSPDLFAKVVAGELTANAAAIEAGFKKKPTPFEQILKLLPKLAAGPGRGALLARKRTGRGALAMATAIGMRRNS